MPKLRRKNLLKKSNKSLMLKGKEEGVLLHRKEDKKLTWEETFKSMSEERENWNDFDVTLMDGLEEEKV
jgi:antitoxin MazE